MKTQLTYKAIISLLFAFFFIFSIGCAGGDDGSTPIRTFFKFNPTNPDHLKLLLTATDFPIPDSIELGGSGTNPVIIVSLTNTGISDTDPVIPGKWKLTPTPFNDIFSTSSDPVLIDDPVGFAPMTVDLEQTIIITNLNDPDIASDDQIVFYKVQVKFSEGIGATYEFTLRVAGTTAAIGNNGTLMMTTPCQSLNYELLVNGQVTMDYDLKGVITYYDRSRRSGLGSPTISDDKKTITLPAQSASIRDIALGAPAGVGQFTFTTIFPACLPFNDAYDWGEGHLGVGKDGLGASGAFEISSAEHLEVISYLVNELNTDFKSIHFKIMGTIDLGLEGAPWSETSSETNSESILGKGFSSIGEITGTDSQGNSTGGFGGEIDCMGHVIKNLYINDPDADDKGLFGRFGNIRSRPGVIRNCHLEDVNITGRDNIGAFGGEVIIRSLIINSYVTGKVSGLNKVGGMAGNTRLSISISNSYSTATVSGNNDVGGLVGTMGDIGDNNVSSISNSYNTGSVTGTGNRIGGLVGEFITGRIQDTYATGSVSGINFVGGLVGASTSLDSIPSDATLEAPALYRSYYAGPSVTGATSVGSIVGTAASVGSTYWPSDYTIGPSDGIRGFTGRVGVVGRTRVQMQVPAPVDPPAGGSTDPDVSVYVGWPEENWSFGQYPVLKTVACVNRQYVNPVPDACTTSLP